MRIVGVGTHDDPFSRVILSVGEAEVEESTHLFTLCIADGGKILRFAALTQDDMGRWCGGGTIGRVKTLPYDALSTELVGVGIYDDS